MPGTARKKTTRRKKAARKKSAARAEPTDPTPAAKGRGSSDPLDYCPACGEYKPLGDWALGPGEKLPAKAFVCKACRRAKNRPKEDFLPELPGRARRILRDVIQSRSIGDAAKKNGLSVERVRGMLKGRQNFRDMEGEMLRAAWQELLVLEGLDLLTIARIARLTLHATRPYWNKATDDWDFFPDHMARIQAARWLVRLQGADPTAPRPPDPTQRTGSATIVLDLGTDRSNPAPDAFTIDVTPEKE